MPVIRLHRFIIESSFSVSILINLRRMGGLKIKKTKTKQ